ncbi:MAG TPA: hypothetical protein VMM80_11940 [Bacteroidota bacterium]|nr:hypothetical protein [Bacteroidota bacterium]
MASVTPETAYTALICAVIIVFGFYEYRRREEIHRLRMELLRRGDIPPDTSREWPQGRLLATGLVSLLYAACLGGVISLTSNVGPKYAGSLATIVALLSLPLLFLVLMFIRDMRRYMHNRKEGEA